MAASNIPSTAFANFQFASIGRAPSLLLRMTNDTAPHPEQGDALFLPLHSPDLKVDRDQMPRKPRRSLLEILGEDSARSMEDDVGVPLSSPQRSTSKEEYVSPVFNSIPPLSPAGPSSRFPPKEHCPLSPSLPPPSLGPTSSFLSRHSAPPAPQSLAFSELPSTSQLPRNFIIHPVDSSQESMKGDPGQIHVTGLSIDYLGTDPQESADDRYDLAYPYPSPVIMAVVPVLAGGISEQPKPSLDHFPTSSPKGLAKLFAEVEQEQAQWGEVLQSRKAAPKDRVQCPLGPLTPNPSDSCSTPSPNTTVCDDYRRFTPEVASSIVMEGNHNQPQTQTSSMQTTAQQLPQSEVQSPRVLEDALRVSLAAPVTQDVRRTSPFVPSSSTILGKTADGVGAAFAEYTARRPPFETVPEKLNQSPLQKIETSDASLQPSKVIIDDECPDEIVASVALGCASEPATTETSPFHRHLNVATHPPRVSTHTWPSSTAKCGNFQKPVLQKPSSNGKGSRCTKEDRQLPPPPQPSLQTSGCSTLLESTLLPSPADTNRTAVFAPLADGTAKVEGDDSIAQLVPTKKEEPDAEDLLFFHPQKRTRSPSTPIKMEEPSDHHSIVPPPAKKQRKNWSAKEYSAPPDHQVAHSLVPDVILEAASRSTTPKPPAVSGSNEQLSRFRSHSRQSSGAIRTVVSFGSPIPPQVSPASPYGTERPGPSGGPKHCPPAGHLGDREHSLSMTDVDNQECAKNFKSFNNRTGLVERLRWPISASIRDRKRRLSPSSRDRHDRSSRDRDLDFKRRRFHEALDGDCRNRYHMDRSYADSHDPQPAYSSQTYIHQETRSPTTPVHNSYGIRNEGVPNGSNYLNRIRSPYRYEPRPSVDYSEDWERRRRTSDAESYFLSETSSAFSSGRRPHSDRGDGQGRRPDSSHLPSSNRFPRPSDGQVWSSSHSGRDIWGSSQADDDDWRPPARSLEQSFNRYTSVHESHEKAVDPWLPGPSAVNLSRRMDDGNAITPASRSEELFQPYERLSDRRGPRTPPRAAVACDPDIFTSPLSPTSRATTHIEDPLRQTSPTSPLPSVNDQTGHQAFASVPATDGPGDAPGKHLPVERSIHLNVQAPRDEGGRPLKLNMQQRTSPPMSLLGRIDTSNKRKPRINQADPIPGPSLLARIADPSAPRLSGKPRAIHQSLQQRLGGRTLGDRLSSNTESRPLTSEFPPLS